ncbi:hypothetical protein FRC09_018534 [Ceratobasidium sp. 395]|nr:hypothetical protein FRC09_018534 [Ceratobasidium sp. 395]
MSSTAGEWVSRLSTVDSPEKVILQALEESLASNTLAAFNLKLEELANSDAQRSYLHSTPLELVPVLLSGNSTILEYPVDARQTLQIIAEHGSPKEVLLVVEESLDFLARMHVDDDEQDLEVESISQILTWKWINLLEMDTLAFPRLVLRKRSAPETATPVVKHLCKSFNKLGPLFEASEPRGWELVDLCIRFGRALLGWFDARPADPEKIPEAKAWIQALLFSVVAECLSDSALARAESDFIGRLTAASSDFAQPTSSLDLEIDHTKHLTGEFVLSILTWQDSKPPVEVNKSLQFDLPSALFCLSQPKWRLAAVWWLTECITTGLGEGEYLNNDIATEIIPAVSSVSATDPVPETRAASFHVLTEIILKVHPEVAFDLVRQLAGEECPFSNMQSAAIGLLRRLVVRAFNKKPPAADDPFAAPILLREYAPILFKSPLLDETVANDSKVKDPQEVNRIVESLGFYYVLLARDTNNLTGVRDPAFLKETNTTFVGPLRKRLALWGAESNDQETQAAARTIELSLERVEDMLSNLGL